MCTPPYHSRHLDHQVGRPPPLPHGHAGGVAALPRLQHHGGLQNLPLPGHLRGTLIEELFKM